MALPRLFGNEPGCTTSAAAIVVVGVSRHAARELRPPAVRRHPRSERHGTAGHLLPGPVIAGTGRSQMVRQVEAGVRTRWHSLPGVLDPGGGEYPRRKFRLLYGCW